MLPVVLAASLTAMPLAPAGAQDQEKVPVNAFAVWTSEGAVAQSDEKKLVMASALTGTLFVETTEGPVASGHVVCPAMLHVDTETGRQTGNGFCTFTAQDGARAFGEWDCTGVHMVGCQGKFRLTGGTGRLAGIKGSSSLVLRGGFHELDLRQGKPIGYTVSGIALWRDLKIELP
jgi:hypothetical protein